MTTFYWVMGVLIVGTLLPTMMFWVLYAVTGETACQRRASALWTLSRVLTLLGFNVMVWGHVIVGLWRLKFG